MKEIEDFVNKINLEKPLFTAGPSCLLAENLIGLRPCFGRGDRSYQALENDVLDKVKRLSGHCEVTSFQGGGSLAMEIMIANFASGRVLIVDTGYYSQRGHRMAVDAARNFKFITELNVVSTTNLGDVAEKYDWIFACFTETSSALKLDIAELNALKARTGARLMLDAAASIGLEEGHEIADVISFSSCKGLFGLTGAGFVAFNDLPINPIENFNMNIFSHLDKKMTGPYHAICSMAPILADYEKFRLAVVNTKQNFCERYSDHLIYATKNQPLLCTQVSLTLRSKVQNAVMYVPRTRPQNCSIVCHLGEVYLGPNARGEINDLLISDANMSS